MNQPNFDRRQFVQMGLLGAASLTAHDALEAAQPATEGELLYNGIRLPTPFPPRIKDVPRDPVTPAYLTSPPAVIPIDVGRQLFVDDFLVERTTLTRTHHRPAYHARNPVLTGGMVFSDGVWYDPRDRIFKMWYLTKGGTAYATSRDGLAWDKPVLDVVRGPTSSRPAHATPVPFGLISLRRTPISVTKCFAPTAGRKSSPGACGSTFRPTAFTGPTASRPVRAAIAPPSTTIRSGVSGSTACVTAGGFRAAVATGKRAMTSSRAPSGAPFTPAMWCGVDRLDPPRPDYQVAPELYNLDGVAYESIILGLFTIWRGQFPQRPKPNEVCVGYSRDGWSWTRPDRRGFLPISENKGDWNWGNVQSAGGCCLVVGDKLYFYCSGRGDGNVTSLAILRRDGFASMDAGTEEGALTTRPVRFRGRHLFVNVDSPKGELCVEVLDRDGAVIAPFSRKNCTPIRADRTSQHVQWQGAADLSGLAGQAVKFRFHLTNGKLYAFWVSPDASGASHGYIAAGGPGFAGLTDTVGTSRGR